MQGELERPELKKFLKKSIPLLDHEIKRAMRSRAFALVGDSWGDRADLQDGSTVRKLHTLEAKLGGEDQVLSVADVSWNSSGSTVAVVYKACHSNVIGGV